MKKLLVATLIAGALAGSVFAQAIVNFEASPSHGLVYYSTDDATKTAFPTGNPASYGTYGNLNIAVYYAAEGTVSPFSATTAGTLGAAWTESENVLHQVVPLAGWTPPTTFTLGSATGGAHAEVMVLGWTGTYGDWNSAVAANTANPGSVLLGWTGSTLSGGALAWDNATGDLSIIPPTTPAPLTYGSQGFNGLVLEVVAIPEPSMFALAGLGAAVLLIFHCRK